MNTITRHLVICAALLGGWLSAGEPPRPVPAPATNIPSAGPLAGRWKVQFANGVVEECRITTNGTALVSQPERTSGGRTQVRGAATVIAYDDDRAERWTPVGARWVVEHWYPIPPAFQQIPGSARAPGITFSHPEPVVGIAERLADTAPLGGAAAPRDDTDTRVQPYLHFNQIPTNAVLRLGMSLAEFIKVLGKPTIRYRLKDGQIVGPEYQGPAEDWVEWYHNPMGLHVAPFLRIRVEQEVVKEVRTGRA